MIRNTILLLLIIFISSKAFAIDFEGKFRQGHFIIGKTEPKSKIWIDKKPIKVSSDGFFVFGIDRDRKYDVVITKMNEGKKEKIAMAQPISTNSKSPSKGEENKTLPEIEKTLIITIIINTQPPKIDKKFDK